MKNPGEPLSVAVLRTQAHILEEVATGGVLAGTLDDLARQFGVPPDDLRRSLRALVRAHWVAVQTLPFGHLTVRIERRSLGPRAVASDRRRTTPDAWSL